MAPTLALRGQAATAIAGFANALTSTTAQFPARLLKNISDDVAAILLPSKETPDTPASMLKVLRTTIAASSPAHSAQGPVWAVSVLCSLSALLGSALRDDSDVLRAVTPLWGQALKNAKSSVRAVGCVAWRTLSWAYCQPAFPEAEQDDGTKEKLWNVVKSVLDISAGFASVAFLLPADEDEETDMVEGGEEEERLRKAMELLGLMIAKGGQACGDAMEILLHLFASTNPPASSFDDSPKPTKRVDPLPLLLHVPTLLASEFKSLSSVVKPLILEATPPLASIRTLSTSELSKEWIWKALLDLWRDAVGLLEIPEGVDVPEEIVGIWEGLVACNGEDRSDQGVEVLRALLEDKALDLRPKPSEKPAKTSPLRPSRHSSPPLMSNAALKYRLVHSLFTQTSSLIPAEPLLLALIETRTTEEGGQEEWADLCADLCLIGGSELLNVFWDKWVGEGDKKKVWMCFQDKWVGTGGWEECVLLLAMAFA